MAEALASGLKASGMSPSLCVKGKNENTTDGFAHQLGIKSYNNSNLLEILIIAVKPHQIQSAVQPLLPLAKNTIVISVAAGVDCKSLVHILNHGAIVRAMPNLAIANQCGMTALFSESASPMQQEVVGELFSGLGQTMWLEADEQMHAVTVLLGSGPAFFMHFTQSLLKWGRDYLPQDICDACVKHASSAANDMMSQYPIIDAVNRVASKGGVTEAGLNVLTQKLDDLMGKALSSSVSKSHNMTE
jgi:pyrroline-5-carboxylate reductase